MTMTSTQLTDALEAALAAGERGVQVAAYLDGRLIADEAAGQWEPAGGGDAQPVTPDTLFPVFSITKAVTATAVHLLVQRGLLSYDTPIAKVWPDYGAHGKDEITVGHVLCHRSGVPQIDASVTLDVLDDWDALTAMVADQVPVAPPDTMNAYSAYSFGWTLGEVIRRTDPLRRGFHQFVRDDVLAPLGMDDFFLGLPDGQVPRVAALRGQTPPAPAPGSLLDRVSPAHLPFGPLMYNDRRVQRAGLPSAGGIATAQAVARLFSVYAQRGRCDGAQFLTEATIRRCEIPRPAEPDRTYGYVMPVGLGGLWLTAPGVSASSPGGALTEGILSHTGAGGTLGWAEPSIGLSVAILHNRTFFGSPDPLPFGQIGDAVHALAADQKGA
jgi:CubicO group peptidase (beta-lactamase class C family)